MGVVPKWTEKVVPTREYTNVGLTSVAKDSASSSENVVPVVRKFLEISYVATKDSMIYGPADLEPGCPTACLPLTSCIPEITAALVFRFCSGEDLRASA